LLLKILGLEEKLLEA
jgi:hypothetical protein